MKVKETIAFVGKVDRTSAGLIQKLANLNYPLILVNEHDDEFERISQDILSCDPDADIAVVDCVKEGCWEADVIVFTNGSRPDPVALEKVRTVTTQKNLVSISHDETGMASLSEHTKALQLFLPYANVTQVHLHGDSASVIATGSDEAGIVVFRIFADLGYKNGISRL